MMGDRDYRKTITSTIDALAKDTEMEITNPEDNKTIYLHEIVRCMRRSYFDRFDRLDQNKKGFDGLFGGLVRKLQYGSKIGSFDIDEIKLNGQADMIVDDIVIIFKKSSSPNLDIPNASDVLYLNACMWIFNKKDGAIVYLAGDDKESSFIVMRNKKMFEETIRRVRVFSNLIGEKKIPILEPSQECSGCQYYERCYIKKQEGKQFTLSEFFNIKK